LKTLFRLGQIEQLFFPFDELIVGQKGLQDGSQAGMEKGKVVHRFFQEKIGIHIKG
jgi:hypothetical protein